MQHPPRISAFYSFARLEHHHQCVETVPNLLEIAAFDAIARGKGFGVVTKVVLNLEWIQLLPNISTTFQRFSGVLQTNPEIIVLFFSSTPDGVIEAVAIAYQSKPFVRIVEAKRSIIYAVVSTISVLAPFSFGDSKAPIFDVDMLGPLCNSCIVIDYIDWCSIEVLPCRAYKGHDGRRKICV